MTSDSLKNLSRSEKILMLNDLWDDLSVEDDGVELSEKNKRILDQRWQILQEDPSPGDSWKEVKGRISEDL